jgi:hypothetical protein
MPNAPLINRPVGPSSDDHHVGVPSASAARQPDSGTIRDLTPLPTELAGIPLPGLTVLFR